MDPTEYLDRKFAGAKPRKCWMCACLLTRGTASVDHLQPKSKGGKDRADNYRLACKPCNAARGNKSIPKHLRLELRGRPKPKPRDYRALAAAIRANRAA
jgi:5-methylcytosine-specific restriction endonuclease McrA